MSRRRLWVTLLVSLAIAWGGLGATLASGTTPKLGLDLQGGFAVVLKAPPDADRVFYIATADALGRGVSDKPLAPSEAVSYWWEEVNRRTRQKLDDGLELRQLDYGLLEALAPDNRK